MFTVYCLLVRILLYLKPYLPLLLTGIANESSKLPLLLGVFLWSAARTRGLSEEALEKRKRELKKEVEVDLKFFIVFVLEF